MATVRWPSWSSQWAPCSVSASFFSTPVRRPTPSSCSCLWVLQWGPSQEMHSCTSYHRDAAPPPPCLWWNLLVIVFCLLQVLGLHDDTHSHDDEHYTEEKEYLWKVLGMIAGIYAFFLLERLFSLLVPRHSHVRFFFLKNIWINTMNKYNDNWQQKCSFSREKSLL